MLVLKPDKIAIIVLHELTHILMQSPAGNAYTYCCENVGRIIKVYFFFYLSYLQSESIAKVENDRKRKNGKKNDIFVSGALNDVDLVIFMYSPINTIDRVDTRYYLQSWWCFVILITKEL